MAQHKYVIGVDGGGTKTLGLLLREDEAQLARSSDASTNIHAVAHDEVRARLQGMIRAMCAEAGIDVAALHAVCLGMAGCDSPADRATLESFLKPILSPTTSILMVNDAIVAARAVLGRMHGLLLIAGTGSICFGWNDKTGESARCGGWGHLLADEGSGYRIGLSAMIAYLRAVDGRGEATLLQKSIAEHLSLKEPREILQFAYGANGTKANVAALARHVMDADAAGDAVAGAILDREADALIELLGPVHRKLFTAADGRVRLGLWGGNLIHVARYRDRFLTRLERTGLPLEAIIKPEADAVLGAAKHALLEGAA